MTQVTNRTVYGTAQLDELAAFTYTFDRAGDRLSNVGNRASSSVTNAAGFSKIQKIDAYGYDTLHRLTQVDYNNTWQTANEDYVYDELGNRVTYSDHRNSITRGYANDKANQYTSIVSNGVTHTVTHDDAGNLASQVVNGSGDAYVYTYDCDNRLLKVDHDPTTGGNVTVATFAYDALGRKITAWTQYDGATDSRTSDLRFYHDGQVEIADYNSDGSLARRFVSGTQYIDERAVLIEGEAGDNGAPVDAETFYYMLQELYTVTGLMKVNGTLTEAHTFDGYGQARLWHYSDGDFNRDGAVNATDQTRFTAALGVSSGIPAADPLADLDLDGDVDLTDSYAFTQIKNGGGALVELFTAATGNPFYFTGRRLYMLETLPEGDTTPVANQQLQHNRARHYSPMEGRWLQRDSSYADGANLFLYGRDCPPNYLDAHGMFALPFVACCKYRTTTIRTGVGMGGTGSKEVSVSYATEDCPVGARSPLSCCRTCPTKTSPWEQITKTPVRAWWGSCCFCKIKKRRAVYWVRTGNNDFEVPLSFWGLHVIVSIECPDGKNWTFDHPPCDISQGFTDILADQYPVILEELEVPCQEIDSVVDEAQRFEDEEPGYGLIKDCYWAPRELWRRIKERLGNDKQP